MSRTRDWRGKAAAVTLLAAATTALAALPATAAPEAAIRNAGGEGAVPNSFIVVLKDSAEVRAASVATVASDLATTYGAKVGRTYDTAIRGFSMTVGESQARRLAADPQVEFVEQNRTVRISGTQPNPPSWGLDRIDQRALPLNQSYTYPNDGTGVNVYVVDTGIRVTHQDFGGRAVSGYDFIDNDTNADDCQGHGTHVAGTVAGTAHGVAKGAKVHAVRVLNCQGSGTYEQVIAGINWVANNAVKPAAANMSLGGGASDAVDAAVRGAITKGVTFALAAGNGDIFGRPQDACTVSPARTQEAITVGATDRNDNKATFSNFGTCVDIFAPGVDITSAWKDNDTITRTISGTSMAAPHVAGAAALVLQANPAFTPQQVRDAMVNAATPDKVVNPGTGSPNKLLFVGEGGTTPPPSCTLTNDNDVPVPDLATVESPVTVADCAGNAATVTVDVNIKHTWRGDLVVDLLAPDGTPFRLKGSSGSDSADDVVGSFTVNAGGKAKNGVWKLRVQDVARSDTGTILSWTIKL
ncbi:S8 family serine peptidase [Crossiella sp. CA-258035]|uniref:S8 family peptidase n=1 Tax=Crossiella sp. CA-258035 TaxID=2981138 RepID=UPI0024BC62D0|nr:S8 family peptidase [Crossiella sp. CA-258035]WHT17709.1 S8 family serine peptidase [Crossiella sp. CA-258035]